MEFLHVLTLKHKVLLIMGFRYSKYSDMEKTNNAIRFTGIVFIAISSIIFYFPNDLWVAHNEMGIFTFHYLAALLFAGIILVDGIRNHSWRLYNIGKDKILLMLTLFMISAFALNRDITVFDESVLWLSILLVVQGITFMIYGYREKSPKVIDYFIYFSWGLTIWLYIYFALYLFPLYAIGFIGLIFFGITIHLFIPILTLIVIVNDILKNLWKRSVWLPASTGFLISTVIICYSAIKWNQVNVFFRDDFHKSLTKSTNEMLPSWVKLAQKLPKDYFFSQYLKLDIIYVSDLFSFGSFNFHDQKRHDPLINTLANLMPPHTIPIKEKLNILRINEDLRHQTEDRLWSGKDLKTDHIINRIEVYPQYRISYTDLIMTIHNMNNYDFNQQEALYTFYLPDGAVATSLSLWIEGEEQKARLTTKHKADSAYTSIVTRRQDPSVVHWQEGNRLQVRVFPCTPKEPRVFRVGITAPLKHNQNELVYQPIYFKGPSTANATEDIEISNKDNAELFVPVKLNHDNSLQRKFSPGFTFSVKASEISEDPFVYKDSAYSVAAFNPEYEETDIRTLYLDLNNEWSNEEIEEILKMGLKVRITDTDHSLEPGSHQITEFLNKNFSFIPFHLINEPEHSLIITKGTNNGPFLKDLQNTQYLKKLNGLKSKRKLKIFSLNDTISPYLRTLIASHYIIYDKGDIQYLKKLINSNQFLKNEKKQNQVSLPNADVSIVKQTGAYKKPTKINPPDHLLRLYNYLALMEEMQLNYLFEKSPPEHLYLQAEKAFAVTPFTSLIVLEQLSDYERFDIQKNIDTLGNASFNNSGAIPEPHEWLLIILFGVIVSSLLFKRIF